MTNKNEKLQINKEGKEKTRIHYLLSRCIEYYMDKSKLNLF